jgi:hypothetical protein
MTDRILITGRNRDLPRNAFSNIHHMPKPRPSRLITRVWMAGEEAQIPSAKFLSATKPHSGVVPGSTEGGALHLVQTHDYSCRRTSSLPQSTGLEVHWRACADLALILVAGCLAVAIMTMVLV